MTFRKKKAPASDSLRSRGKVDVKPGHIDSGCGSQIRRSGCHVLISGDVHLEQVRLEHLGGLEHSVQKERLVCLEQKGRSDGSELTGTMVHLDG